MGYTTALAADAATYRTGLAPLETLVAAVVIGSGIVAGQSQQAVNALVNSVSKIIKDNTVRKQEEDPAFESPYRVIQGGGSGSDPTPEEPNNNNRNGRWFGLVGASSLGSALLFEKGAVEEIMRTLQQQNAYNPLLYQTGFVSPEKLNSTANLSNVSLQLANISNSALGQFDQFIHSDTWLNQGVSADECYFCVTVNLPDIYASYPYYPALNISIYHAPQNQTVGGLNITKNVYSYGTFSNNYGSLNRYYSNGQTNGIQFLNNDRVPLNMETWGYYVPTRNSSSSISISGGKNSNSPYYNVNVRVGGFTDANSAICGYIGATESPFQYTNNVYNQNQTFNVNFPDWLQQSITLLGKQIDAVNLGLQNLSKINWAQTQQQIQTAPATDAAVSQAINNWENPGNIPEPEPNPDPDPDPDPSPEEEPAHEAAVTDGAESIYNWVSQKITLPSGIFEKIPFSIPYDLYLLLRSMFPTSNRVRKKAYFTVSNVQNRSNGNAVLDPSGITVSSHFDAVAKNTKTYDVNWKPAPVINLDLHFSYTDVGGQKKALDIVKTVDLQPYSYFAMIVYIGIYISWLVAVLGWILESFA